MSVVNFLAPSPGATFSTRYGNFTADANGLISNVTVNAALVADLLAAGCVPLSFNPYSNPRNLLDGGDFSQNPWQRAATSLFTSGLLATAITGTTPTYGPDRFFAVGSGSSPSVLFTQLADTTVPGFVTSCQVSRSPGNGNLSPIYFGQVVESADAYKAQGQPVTLSFYARAAANYSGGNLSVQLTTSTGSNQSAANLIAGSWSSQNNIALTPAQSNGVAGTVAQQPINQTMQRYVFTGFAPLNTNQIGVLISFTGSGTAGAADGVIFNGVQLEIGASATQFEHEDVAVVLEECQRYCYVVPEPAAGVWTPTNGNLSSATNANLVLTLQVQMYKPPALTLSLGSFKIVAGGAQFTPSALTPNANHTVAAAGFTATVSGATAGQGATLQGGGGTGYILASADF